MKKENRKIGFTLIELMATLVIIIVVLAISVPLISDLLEIVRREAFRATAYSIVDSGRFLLASNEATNEEFYYRDGVEYNADNKKLDYTGKGPETGTVILNEKGTVAIAIHNGTYCATKSADEKKVTVTKTTPDDCNAYTIIRTCDTWEEIALKYDVTLSSLLKLNNETDSNSSTCDRDIKIPVSSTSSDSVIAGGGPTVYYKTYYTVGYVGYSNPYPGTNYEYTIELGVLPLAAKDIEAVRVVAHSVFEELDDFKRYIVKKNMREVIWPGEEPKQIDISQASVFKDHAATSSNMVSDDVTAECDNETCHATIAATVNNLNNVNPNTINGYEVAYTPIKFTVEFNGESAFCTVRTSQDAVPGTLAGSGTGASPYLVESVEDLVALSNTVNAGNNYSGKYISLTNTFDFKNQKSYKNYQSTAFGDINGNGTIEGLMTELTTGAGFIPIGNNTTKFSGTLLGNTQCINNLYVNRGSTSYVGLFGYNSGKIQNLGLNDFKVTGYNYTGGLTGTNYGTIIDASVKGDVKGNNYVALLEGFGGDSRSATSITAEGNVTGVSYVAGLAGYLEYRSNIRGVLKGGTITATGSNVGRIIGGMYYDMGVVRGYAMSSVTVNGSNVSSTYINNANGTSINNISDVTSNINAAELVYDTYIGGDNDGDGYYWDYNNNGVVVRKSIVDYPLTFALAGSGTASDPYLISSYSDLKQATLKLESVYKLLSNIDLSGQKFYMLGSYINNFTGTFNGNQKTISNMTINAPKASYIGFVGYNTGTVRNLNLIDLSLTANNYVGGAVGTNYGSIVDINTDGNVTANNYAALIEGFGGDSRTAIGLTVQGNVTGSSYIGGLAGYLEYHSTLRGINKGGSITASGSNAGRITGGVYYDYSINRGYAMSSVTVNGSTVSSTYINNIHGTTINNMSDVTSNINASELVLDTYIGGDNDGDGYYWDYNTSGVVVERSVSDYPLTFSLAGAGTAIDPYLISSYSDLRQAALKLGSVYKLTTDLDISGQKFYMLGSYINNFTGTFNGNQKTISNMSINAPKGSFIGFIGYNTGTVRNLSLTDLSVNGNNYIGGVVGTNYGSIVDVNTDGNVTGNDYVALIEGFGGDSRTAIGLTVQGNVTGTSYVGGLAGYIEYHSTVRGINKGGSITATGSNAGRIIGYNYYDYGYSRGYAMSSVTVNGSTVSSTYINNINGTSINSMSDVTNNINTSELVLDTYIGGDNDGDGYYWDYNTSGIVVERSVSDYPLIFALAGSGTAADPYLISSYSDLRQATLKLGSVYRLTTDLDISGQRFYMLGSYINNFTGTFNGNQNNISNMVINAPKASHLGFIGYNTGTVRNLSLANLSVSGNNYIGGSVGTNYGSIVDVNVNGDVSGNNYVALIEGFGGDSKTAIGVTAEGNVYGVSYVGGLAGYLEYHSTVRGINKGGSITATSANFGRIIGYNYYGYGISRGYAMSSITVNGSTINSTYIGSNDGSDINSLGNVTGNINASELVLDTYIGGDNDGDGYYWDYDNSGVVVEKSVSVYPLTFALAGSGTTASPYLVNSYDDLRQATLKLGSVYKLTSNIDLSGQRFYMLGSYINNFTGSFYGGAMTLSNININAPKASYLGFSGNNGGTIKGLYISNANISGQNAIGLVTGQNNGTIKDIAINGNVSGNNHVGLVFGYGIDSKTATNIVAEGDASGASYVGGLAGYLEYHSTIKGVNQGGTVNADNSNAGRIFGGSYYGYGTSYSYAISSIPVNGIFVTSTSTSGIHGSDVSSSDLSNQTIYTNAGFNFTDETQDYIWYIDGGTAKFREGSL